MEPEDLRIADLEKRCGGGTVKEIIIALPSDVEGDANIAELNLLARAKNVLRQALHRFLFSLHQVQCNPLR